MPRTDGLQGQCGDGERQTWKARVTDDEQLAALQTELTFQGQTIVELNDALAAQQRDILLLQRQLRLLAEDLGRLRTRHAASELPDAGEPPPPHY
jgi:SlyX protein